MEVGKGVEVEIGPHMLQHLLLHMLINQLVLLREKCPYSELFSPNAEKYGPE